MKSLNIDTRGCKNKRIRSELCHCFTVLCIFALSFLFSTNSAQCRETGQVPKIRQLVDQTGRVVKIVNNPLRVISLAPSITEIIFDLHRENRLKGVTKYSDFPVQAEKLPKIGSYIQLDLEKIVRLRPDLCIAVKDGNPIQTVQRLCSLGIPVYAVNPVNLESVMDTVTDIGGLLNAGTRANALVFDMKLRIKKIKSIVLTSN